MTRFNLSEWAIRHRSLVSYFMLVIMVAGLWSYFRLGRSEDPGLHRQDDGGAGRVAGRHGRRHARADHRPPRAQASGDPESRLPEELHDRGPSHRLRQPEGFDAPRSGVRHLVPGAQEGRRHPKYAPARNCRAGLQRRVRRYLRHRLRFHRRRLLSPRVEGHRGRSAKAAASAAGYLEDRCPRGPGRARLLGVLDRAVGGPRHRPLRADCRAAGPERRGPFGRPANWT